MNPVTREKRSHSAASHRSHWNVHTLAFVKSRLVQTLRQPVKAPYAVHVLRTVLLKPGLFDLASLVLQVRDLGRLAGAARAAETQHGYKAEAFDHNYGTLLSKRMTTTRRMEPVYRAVAALRGDLGSARLLAIGSRNVHELFVAWLYGFSWQNIEGIDLYSAHPKIQPMDMEDMAFSDATFDVVTMSHTLAYATDVARPIREVARVLKPHGLFSFQHTYGPDADRFQNAARTPVNKILELLRECGLAIRLFDKHGKIARDGLAITSYAICAEKAVEFEHVDVP